MPRSTHFAKLFALILMFTLTQFAASASSPIVNDSPDDPSQEWTIQTKQASLDLVSLSQWRKCTVTFNSGPYKKARVYLGAYGATTGRCWIDNLKPSGFSIENPSFENVSPDGRSPVGWSPDDPGKITHVVSDPASDGGHSVLFYDPSGKASMIRISQVVDVQPNTDYSYTFDIYMDSDFISGIRCSVLAEDPIYYAMGYMKEDLDEVVADRSRVGNWQHHMRLDGGSASMTKTVKVPDNAIMEAVADVRIKTLSGALKYTVEDAASGEVLGSVQEVSSNGYWKRLSIRFTSPSKEVRLRITGEGTGEAMISGVRVTHPLLVPQPQKIAWRSSDDAFRHKGQISYSLTGKFGGLLDAGIVLLAKDLLAHGIRLVKTNDKSVRLSILVGKSSKAPKDRGPESYYLSVGRQGVRIEAGTEAGAFYGVMTVLQLLTSDSNGMPAIIGCEITDWPDFPWRSLDNGAGKDPEWMARRKFNHVEYGSEALIGEYLKYGIISIPHDNITHYPYKGQPGVLADPNMCEGVGQTDKLVLKGEEPAELSGRNVVRTKLTGIVVKSEDGKTTYTEGKDYTIIPGEMVFKGVVNFSQESGLFRIVRKPDGRIADGQTVSVTYEHIRSDCWGMCLAESEPKSEVAKRAAEMVKNNNLPFMALHASECPPCTGKGPRCQATGQNASQLLADYYRNLDKAIKKANPKCRIYAWTDDFMPWQNSERSGLGDVAKMMPKDAIMGNWWYGPGGTVDFNVKTARLWSGLGHDFIVMGWYDYANIRETAAVALWARENGMPCLGTSSWAYPSAMLATGDISFLDETARCSWRVPRPGEVGYVDVDASLKKKGNGDGQ